MSSLLISMVLASAGLGEPIYLRCPFERAEVLITADEANSTVTVALPSTGHSEKLSAAFTASEVRFQNSNLTYVLSRVDLSITRTIKMIKATDRAQCAIEKAPKRAF
ncbi:MAG: hypothetical protein V4808_07020 [Pseudomonadota bacterium]